MKLFLKKKAWGLRRRGFSISDIAKELQIAESTASLWCREIRLTQLQEGKLEKRTNRKLKSFFALVASQKQAREKKRIELIERSAREVGKLSGRELFIAGVSLYWAEGFKHAAEGRIGFCNSDPEMLKFEIKFFEKCLGVEESELSLRVSLNESFVDRTDEIQEFWSERLGVRLEQFTRPFYQKAKRVKVYADRNDYHGVLRVHARKSSKLMMKMRGYMQGLKNSL